MKQNRDDETWHRLRDWTKGQAPSERLAAQILIYEGFSNFDPSHPLGGKDGGKDAIADKGNMRFAMGAYFPRGQQTFKAIKKKFDDDLAGARQNSAGGIAFVTNQELMLSEREYIKVRAEPTVVELYHLERITTILDTPAMASVRQQFLDIETETTPPIDLGGKGGAAPGAGGGGGGAIGRGAQGGRGGDGGGHRIDNGDYTRAMSEDVPAEIELTELPESGANNFPGAGGGGVGAVGDGAIGGNGGDGGERVSACIDAAELRRDGFHHIEFTVGRGGANGGHGEDTVVKFVTEDGRVLKSLHASGGKAGGAKLPGDIIEITPEDIENKFRLTTLMVANSVEIRDGLFFLLGADWVNFTVPHLPFDAVWPVVCALRWNACQWIEPRGMFLSLIRPDGREVTRQALVIPMESAAGGCFRWVHSVNTNLDMEGIWCLQCHSGPYLLAQLEIPVAVVAQPSA
jgi:hypothetical protein